MAEQFSGIPGVFVPLKESIRGFKAIINGEVDDVPEMAFFNVGTLDDVLEKAKQMQKVILVARRCPYGCRQYIQIENCGVQPCVL